MKAMKILLAMVLITTQAQAAVVSNFIGREIPNQVSVSATAASYTVGAVTFTDAGDLVTLNGHKLANGSAVTFGTITTTTGISINTTYYVISATTNTFQLSATVGGAALPLTTNGTGVLSSSYYAVVHAQVRNGGTFSVNGTVFLTSNTWNTINSNSSPTTVQWASVGGTNAGKALNIPYAPGESVPSSNSSGQHLSTGSTSAGVSTSQTQADTFSNSTAMTSVNETFKVPAGTVLVGSGSASYVIELINI